METTDGQDGLAVASGRKRAGLEIDRLFGASVELGGSDLPRVGLPRRSHQGLVAATQPGTDRQRGDGPPLHAPAERANTTDFRTGWRRGLAYTVECDGEVRRFRVNLLQQLGNFGLVARLVNNFIPNLEGLHLPPVIEELCKFDQGMILLAGVTGSGKSTTIASMLDWINHRHHKHILTL